MKVLLSGNEAIARGAYEAGVRVAAAYPGTPSTEILETIVQYKDINAEWSVNEKVALEVALGAAIAGVRAMACMKHVGVNVAADPLMTASYTGITAGLVIVTADDPDMHSSQNEQDNRHYARFAKVPMLEPADSQEAKDFVKLAFEISERFDTPVFIRTTTRISHAKSIVEFAEPEHRELPHTIKPQFEKYVMLPRNARLRHPQVEERLKKLAAFADEFDRNELILQETDIGIIASGTCYQYAREAFPTKSFLKIAMAYPLPIKKIKYFAGLVDRLYVFEELDPFYEEQIKAMGIAVTGKDVFPVCGEFSPITAQNGIVGSRTHKPDVPSLPALPPRPPNMCPGCPHRGVFYILKQMKVFVSGDIGCYTLGGLPPLNAMHTCICMGASVSGALGIDKALGPNGLGKAVAVIGDSTFLHSGITGLLDIAYNKGTCTVIILDNRTTAMTGRQEHPGTGFTLQGQPTKQLNLPSLCAALGIDHVRVVNPYNLAEVAAALREEIERPEPSVIISQAPCVLHRREYNPPGTPFTVNASACIGCMACLQLGCPALVWHPAEKSGTASINSALCTGCTLCAQICKKEAIQAEA
ncbi:MAG: indolepyruvate ferredoxin oxidoreductase subunit alpha [Desulfobacterota bacterium]|nr:indolepyruvate ferredoxin oxidoreductase subunit alpha [Thermodesulfobacteriota bacterium]